MAFHEIKETRIEVDMVPYIDIVTLLLLFLVFVGDLTRSASSEKMLLPRADQAQKDAANGSPGRIVVQLVKNPNGVYQAVVAKNAYEIQDRSSSSSLNAYLKFLVNDRAATNVYKRNDDGTVNFPVKLRIPKDAPMFEVEKVVATCASAGLVNIHYAAEPPKAKK